MLEHLERRRQPDMTIKAIEQTLKEIDWEIKETTSHEFVHPRGKWINQSRGYNIKIPRDMDYIRHLWIGYLDHKDLQPPGIYAGMNPVLVGPDSPTPRSTGYSLTPEDFQAWILVKQVIPQKEIERMENKYGKEELKEKVKEIIVKTYPFSLK